MVLSYDSRVAKFTSDGVLIGRWNTSSIDRGIAIDSSGNVIVANTFSDTIDKFTNNGILLTQFGSHGTGDGQFNSPHYIAVDSFNNLYVSDTYNHCIQVFALADTILTPQQTVQKLINTIDNMHLGKSTTNILEYPLRLTSMFCNICNLSSV